MYVEKERQKSGDYLLSVVWETHYVVTDQSDMNRLCCVEDKWWRHLTDIKVMCVETCCEKPCQIARLKTFMWRYLFLNIPEKRKIKVTLR